MDKILEWLGKASFGDWLVAIIVLAAFFLIRYWIKGGEEERRSQIEESAGHAEYDEDNENEDNEGDDKDDDEEYEDDDEEDADEKDDEDESEENKQ